MCMIRVGQNHIFIRIHGVHTVFLAEKSPYIRSYTEEIYGSGQPYLYTDTNFIHTHTCNTLVGYTHTYTTCAHRHTNTTSFVHTCIGTHTPHLRHTYKTSDRPASKSWCSVGSLSGSRPNSLPCKAWHRIAAVEGFETMRQLGIIIAASTKHMGVRVCVIILYPARHDTE